MACPCSDTPSWRRPRCEDCAHERVVYNSCRNRHCPKCQGAAARQWLEEREAELLPVAYYHVVFTLPAVIGAIAFQNKVIVYDLLFRTAAETLITIAADPKHLGARIGLAAVLHTWGSALTHHPHVHVIVPGGGLSPDGTRWIACRPGFFLPVRVLSRLFRHLFLKRLAALHETGRLTFFGDLAPLAEKRAFDATLAPLGSRRLPAPGEPPRRPRRRGRGSRPRRRLKDLASLMLEAVGLLNCLNFSVPVHIEFRRAAAEYERQGRPRSFNRRIAFP